MINRIDFPVPDTDVSFSNPENSYARQNNYLRTIAKGFIKASLTNMGSTAAPQVAAGSVIELGGNLYKVTEDENITGSLTPSASWFIYAAVSGEALVFSYSTAAPSWDALKRGWYDGARRAIAKMLYSSNSENVCSNKVILDSYDAVKLLNRNQSYSGINGILFAEGPVNSYTQGTLPIGVYRVMLKAGTGGQGGGGGGAGGTDTDWGRPGGGPAGSKGESYDFLSVVTAPVSYKLSAGGDGNEGRFGQSGGQGNASTADVGGGGGGGGCSGGSSYFIKGSTAIQVKGGAGGSGAKGRTGGTVAGNLGNDRGEGGNGGAGGPGNNSGSSGSNGDYEDIDDMGWGGRVYGGNGGAGSGPWNINNPQKHLSGRGRRPGGRLGLRQLYHWRRGRGRRQRAQGCQQRLRQDIPGRVREAA